MIVTRRSTLCTTVKKEGGKSSKCRSISHHYEVEYRYHVILSRRPHDAAARENSDPQKAPMRIYLLQRKSLHFQHFFGQRVIIVQ
jgi:hypothetical protein